MYMTYDSFGRPASATSPYGSYGTPTVTYAYSASGVLPVWQAKTGPDGYTLTTLDGLGRPIKVQRGPSSTTIQSETDTVYAPCACSPMAKIQKTSMPYGSGSPVWTTYAYDGIGRTLSIQQPDGSSTTNYSYLGNVTTVIDPVGTTTTGATGHWKQFISDVEGNLTIVTEPDPASPTSATLATYYTYDWMKHLVCSSMTRGGTAATLSSYTSGGVTCQTGYTGGTQQTRTFVYDNAGRLTSATNPENGTVTYNYSSDNTLASKVDAKGQAAVYTYDSQKRVTETQRFPSGLSGTEDTCQRVQYSYDYDPYYTGSAPQYTTGRLAATQYYHCDSFSIPDPYDPDDYTDSFGGTTFTEMYSYHPAGAPTGKSLQISRYAWLPCCGWISTSAELTAQYGYDAAGRIASRYVPNEVFYQSYDSMGRPSTLTDSETVNGFYGPVSFSTTWVQNVAYDVAGRMTSVQYQTGYGFDSDSGAQWSAYTTQNMTYNVNGQLASLSWSTPSTGYTSAGVGGSLTYCYTSCTTPTHDNGQITQVTDTISGETIVYAYDALKRLTSATSTPISGSTPAAWTQTYGYDGFGNLTSKVLNGGSNSVPAVTSATNQLTGGGYDLNGNMTTGVGASYTYDEANRIASASPTSGGTEYYGYAPDNKRIYRRNTATGAEEWTFYGAMGEKIGTFIGLTTESGLVVGENKRSVWFAGKLIWDGPPVPEGGSGYYSEPYYDDGAIIYTSMGSIAPGNAFDDRLGSNRALGSRYYPYGEEIGTATTNDREKFATYNRDSFTTLDYADQRYYASLYGRFNTVDPSSHSVHPKSPGSWNRYAYVGGDPVNGNDPRGLDESVCTDPDDSDCPDPTAPDPCWDLSLSLFDGSLNCGAPVSDGDGDASSSGDSSSPPPCWQNVGNISATLSNLGTDIEHDIAGQFDAAGMQLLAADISTDIASELQSLSGGGSPGSPSYIGGHFNLNITTAQFNAFDAQDQAAFVTDFAGTSSDGVRQQATTGLAAAGGYWLHSQVGKNDPGITPGEYSFHFDRFNGQYAPSGTILHGVYDVLGGHLGHPCLDPAWH